MKCVLHSLITFQVEGSLTSKNSGGNSTYPSFMNNPQYHLRLRQADLPAGKADVRLVVEGPRDVPLNVLLVRSPSGERVTKYGFFAPITSVNLTLRCLAAYYLEASQRTAVRTVMELHRPLQE